MRKCTTLFLLIFGFHCIYSQVLDQSPYIDPAIPATDHSDATMAPWDLLFSIQFPNFPLTYVAETDGNYIYAGTWDFNNVDTLIRKYDMQGNFIENLYVAGATKLRDLTFDGSYFYSGLSGSTGFMKIDMNNQLVLDTVPTSFKIRALAYDEDLNVFYGNNWSDNIKKFAADGTLLETIPLSGSYGSYYGFAYDNWSAGGPYLWGFSQDPSHHNIVQMQLPSCTETGFVYDASGICYSIAGGLFTYPDYDSSRAVIGGVIQNTCLFGLELAQIGSPPASFGVGGMVYAGNNPLLSGRVEMFKMGPDGLIENFSTDFTQPGSYLFPEATEGEYYLQARPDASSSYAPTYLGNKIHWEDTYTMHYNMNSLNNTISLLEKTEAGSGIGYVDGMVYELTTDAEIPVEDALVMLLTTGNQCVAVSYTDDEGRFIFENMALGSYSLLVEIPGKIMQPMNINLTQSGPGLSDVLFYVTNEGIMVGIDEYLPEKVKCIGEVYPNPATNKAGLDVWANEAMHLQLKVYSLSGQVFYEQSYSLDRGNNHIRFFPEDLSNGLYYITLESGGHFLGTRKLVVAN